ncbi:hypothetical protein [Candidatus Pantoea formicae]|uniref:hypothetical protein n=1 Tax=Candidatus Pantoea formicae TaxID=2608355 RepID=UPI003EDA374B
MVKGKYNINTASIIGLMALAFLLLVLRRPDIVLHAQPWAEDGKIWMAGIYNNGLLSSLFLPQNGYYQTISRLTYGISMFFGISHAALGANIIAIIIRCFFIGFILSSRMNFAPLPYRLAAVVYFDAKSRRRLCKHHKYEMVQENVWVTSRKSQNEQSIAAIDPDLLAQSGLHCGNFLPHRCPKGMKTLNG